MTPATEPPSRRATLVKIALFFNGIVGVILAVPMVRYVLSSVVGRRKAGRESWVSLGGLGQFPQGETRFAAFRNPSTLPWDGQTANIPCWVRNIDGRSFQVFAINCAHLGCPVRWFPQSNLFMCPCHGGVYYQDGSVASGPPPRGLFQYQHKSDGGELHIKVGNMPTTGSAVNRTGAVPPCA